MAIVHPPVAAPEALFDAEGDEDVNFPAFKQVITDEKTTVAQLFAVLRLWEPMVQEHIGAVAYEMLRRGASVNDKDGLTDMTLLHFAAKSGARGLGDMGKAASVARDLIKQGADVNAVCGWTQMTPLHYAAFFSSTSVLEVLAKDGKNLDINVPCSELEGATPLHMAAMTGSPDAVEMLLEYGSDPTATDARGMTALDCALSVAVAPDNTTPEETWDRIKDLLRSAIASRQKVGSGSTSRGTRPPASASQRSMIPKTAGTPRTATTPLKTASTPTRSTSARTPVRSTPSSPRSQSLDSVLKIGDRVEANGKVGVIRFRGETNFSRQGEWIGIQLERPEGTHNGTVSGVEYFRCKPNHGVFVKPSAVRVLEAGASDTLSQSRRAVATTPSRSTSSSYSTPKKTNSTPQKKTGTTPRRNSGSVTSTPKSGKKGFGVGSKVFVKGKMATVRYIGPINVADGTWLGVEYADQGVGKNDGSLNGERYFKTDPKRGSFVKPDQATWRGIKCSLQL